MSLNTDLVRRYAQKTVADIGAPVFFKSAEGCRITDRDGRSIIDFTSGYGVTNTGWQHPAVIAAMEKQLRLSTFAPPWLPTEEALALAETLLSLMPPKAERAARAAGGADANEVAVKALVSLRGGKVLVVNRAYHGGTSRTLALSDAAAFGLPPSYVPQPPRVKPAYCFRCPYGQSRPGCDLACASAIDKAVADDPEITGVLLEPVIGSGGAIVPPQEYFDAVAEICRRRGLVLILDEVITGCGRIGHFTAAEAYGLEPDAITLAKGMGGGYVPIGAAMLSGELADALSRYDDVSATLAWTPLACAAASANLKVIIDENLCEHAERTGTRLLARVRSLVDRYMPGHFGDVRGKGLLAGIEFVTDQATRAPAPNLAKRVALRCFRNGLMLAGSWDWHSIIITPPLVLDDATLDEAMGILETSLKEVSKAQTKPGN
jgi:4-aminobutyrate aminotransferase-like enzyme